MNADRRIAASALALASALLVVLGSGCGGSDDGGSSDAPKDEGKTGLAWPEGGLPKVHDEWPPYVIMGRRERPRELRWRVDATDSPVDAAFLRDAVRLAFTTWQETGVVAFEETAPPRDADLVISWHGPEGKDCRFIEWDGGIAHAGRVGYAGAVIHLNTQVDWSAHSLSGTVLHEIGHILGIGHSPRSDTLMYGGYDDTHVSLREMDRAALHTIYGGGTDHADDLRIVEFDETGRPADTTAILRRIAPAHVRFAVVDVDGDDEDELMLWRTDGVIGPALTFEFMIGPVVAKTVGPLKGFTRPDRTTWVASDAASGPVVVHVGADGRFVARNFDDKGFPTVVRKDGPLDLDIGLFDEDADGVLDGTTPVAPRIDDGRELLGRADVDQDGHQDHLVREAGGEVRWLLTKGAPDGRVEGPTFAADRIAVGHLDADRRPDGVIRR